MAKAPGRWALFWRTLRVRRLLTDPVYRASRWLYVTNPGEQQQVTTYTEPDRYPLLFASVREAIAVDRPKLLSYGCSTGEEVASLRKVFPSAPLVGADINEAALAQARRNHAETGATFVSSRGGLAGLGPFDAVFCMAVLQRFPTVVAGVDNLAEIYPFTQFQTEVERLHELVAPGGLLVLHLTSYRFADLPTAAQYEVVASEVDRPWNPVSFAPDGSRIASAYKDVIFRRLR